MVDVNLLLSVLQDYGPLILVTVFLLWQGWIRENKLGGRITELEEEQRKVLLPLVKHCTRVIAKNNLIMRRLERALDERWDCKK